MSSDQRKWINRIRTLAEQNPDAVTIRAQPEQNCGYIYASFPAEWLKVSPPKQYTDEQKQAMANRLHRNNQNVPEIGE